MQSVSESLVAAGLSDISQGARRDRASRKQWFWSPVVSPVLRIMLSVRSVFVEGINVKILGEVARAKLKIGSVLKRLTEWIKI